MDISEKNVEVLKLYEELIKQNYKEAVNGVFGDATTAILEGMKCESDSEEISSSDHSKAGSCS